MAAPTVHSFPPDFEADTCYFETALALFLVQAGYSKPVSFLELTVAEQRKVLRVAQAIKREMES